MNCSSRRSATGGEPDGALHDALTRDFGSVAAWITEFAAIGKALRGGSGWVLLMWSPRDRKLVNQWAMDHTTTLAGGEPILALDMYEHSYHIDYGAKAAAYVDAFIAAINWPNVARAYGEAQPSLREAETVMASYKIAIVWRGDREARRKATPANNRFHRVFEELAAIGIHAEPAVYDEEFADEVREQLLGADGVLVWVDPIHQGKTREALDPLLREIASRGPWVSAHPDVILEMGVKEVLYRTKHLGWGTDTYLYRSAPEFREAFPARLQTGARVLKQNRGNGGQGVWKVELVGGEDGTEPTVRVLHAQRGSVSEELPLAGFMGRCEGYFGWGGCIIDQPFQPRLPDGMIRCYMGADRVAGFGHQYIKALIEPPPEGPEAPAAQPGPRIMHGPDAAPFQALRTKMETEWVPQMIEILGLDPASLPIIWDADFLYGPRDAAGADSYVLCEINVSSCFAIPDEAPAAIAGLTLARCRSARATIVIINNPEGRFP